MSETIPLFLLHTLGFTGFLWLGVYALLRGDRGPVSTLFSGVALATACFFLSSALLLPLHAPRGTLWADPSTGPWINRVMWWDNVVPFALWLHVTSRLTPRAARAPGRRPAVATVYGAAILLTILGMVDGIVRRFDHNSVTPGPAFVAYVAYVLVSTGWAVVNFAQMRTYDVTTRQRDDTPTSSPVATPSGELPADRAAAGATGGAGVGVGAGTLSTARNVGGVLLIGSVLFLLATAYLALNTMLRFLPYETPAYVLFVAGLAAIGVAVMIRSGLLLGKDLRRDVVYSATGLAVLLVPYLAATGLMVGFDDKGHGAFTLVLAALITVAHTLNDIGRAWLDRVFFPPVVREERAAARSYAEALAIQPAGPHPDLATRKAFDDAVRRAITHLSDPTKLATSPLLNLTVVGHAVAETHSEDNRLNRAAALREILLDLLDGLKPGDGAGRVTGDAWRYYNALYYPYVRGIGRRRAPATLRQLYERRRREGGAKGELEQVLEWLLDIDENTFYKWQRRGSDTIAATLRERERRAGGAAPGELAAADALIEQPAGV